MKILLVIFAALLSACGPKCIKSHKEPSRCGGYTQFIYVGEIMMPIAHPSYDCEKEICDLYEVKQ